MSETTSIDKITKVTGARRIGDQAADIDWLLTDSRSLCFPEATLFFALKTDTGDGHKYIPELYLRGVRNFVVSVLPDHPEKYLDANFLLTDSPLKALQKLAAHNRKAYQVPVVGVTGSNGKTIVKEWLYQILTPERVVTRSPRSYNSQIGVPLSVWMMDSGTDLAIIEIGRAHV